MVLEARTARTGTGFKYALDLNYLIFSFDLFYTLRVSRIVVARTLPNGNSISHEKTVMTMCTFRNLSCFALALCLTMAGCASRYPVAPREAASPDYKYLVGPGDTVNVVVWRNPELSMSVPVRPDGLLATPLVENMPAIGKDPSTLSRDIEKELSKFIRDPVVTVIVTAFVGPYSEQIRVVGEATKPQVIPYKQKMTMLDVMIAVGGITDFADGNAASILRTSEGNKQYGVRLRDLIKRGDISANVEMKPGDVVIIPQSWF